MSLIKFPGLIDIHVHLRDPGATDKEDFYTASQSALSGGFTYIIDMPNNPIPTISVDRVNEKIQLVKHKAKIDISFYYGTDGFNSDSFSQAAKNKQIFGLKIYMNQTTGTLLIEDEQILAKIFSTWKSPKPILVHAVGETLKVALNLAKKYHRRLHVCHVSQAYEINLIKQAKKFNKILTCGVTPHHLFLTSKDVKKLGAYALMKPEIGSRKNQLALWEGLSSGVIDIIESDHAPHTKAEKNSAKPPFGVPGLETTLGLMLSAYHDKKITLPQLKNWLYAKPKKIFNIPDQKNTYIEFDPEIPYILKNKNLQTKCGWSPFNNWLLYGKVVNLVFKGKRMINKGKELL